VDGKGRIDKKNSLSERSIDYRLYTSLSSDSDQSLDIASSSGDIIFLVTLVSFSFFFFSSSSSSARRILSFILITISAYNAWVLALYAYRRASALSLLLIFKAL
jgi:hypothetical protein